VCVIYLTLCIHREKCHAWFSCWNFRMKIMWISCQIYAWNCSHENHAFLFAWCSCILLMNFASAFFRMKIIRISHVNYTIFTHEYEHSSSCSNIIWNFRMIINAFFVWKSYVAFIPVYIWVMFDENYFHQFKIWWTVIYCIDNIYHGKHFILILRGRTICSLIWWINWDVDFIFKGRQLIIFYTKI